MRTAEDTRRRIRLVQWQCPGDLVILTSCIESLHKQFPNLFVTGVRTNHDDIFDHNPNVTKLVGDTDVTNVLMHYNSIQLSHVPFHFGQSYCDTLGAALGLPLRLQVSRPYLYLSEAEQLRDVLKEKTGHDKPYTLVNAGYKDDMPAKWGGSELYQSVVDAHRDRITFVQVGSVGPGHHHPRLAGAVDLIGKTTLRELLMLVSRASFGIGPITFLGTVFAAFEKPYVCLLGGREPLSWLTMPTQITLNAHGLLPCCARGACWKSTVTGQDDGRKCSLPVIDSAGCTVPTCLAMLRQAAVDAVGVLIGGHSG